MSDVARGRDTMLYTDMRSVQEVTLILTSLESRGDGRLDDPYRLVTQLWTRDGKLVAEWDPCAPPFAPREAS